MNAPLIGLVVVLGTLLLLGLVPALALVLAIRWMDRYEREPLWLVLLAFFLGTTVSLFLGWVGNTVTQVYLTQHLGAELARAGVVVFSAPFFEEIAKLVVIQLLARSSHFDGPVDGVVYGASVGLGFGALENFFYFVGNAQHGAIRLAMVVVLRIFYTLQLHLLCGACSGLAVGTAKIGGFGFLGRRMAIAAGLASAMALHGLGNYLALSSAARAAPEILLGNILGCGFFLGLLFLVFQMELWKESHILLRELEEEVRGEVLSAGELTLVTHYRERLRTQLDLVLRLRWILAWRVHRLAQVAGRLALRKYRAREVPGLEAEIEALRQELKARPRGW